MHSSISNLPARRISLVGRDHEVSTIRHELMQTAGRLLTLTGTGGIGKTQLALEVANRLAGAFPDGVWLVELASLSEPGLVAQSVASALQLRAPSQRPDPEVLLRHLRDRKLPSENVATSARRVLGDRSMAERARAVSRRLQADDPVATACALVATI